MTYDLWQTFSSTVQSVSNKHPRMQLPSSQFKICAMIFKIPTSLTESPIPEIPRQTFYHQDSMPGVDGNIYGIISSYLWPLIKIVGGPNSWHAFWDSSPLKICAIFSKKKLLTWNWTLRTESPIPRDAGTPATTKPKKYESDKEEGKKGEEEEDEIEGGTSRQAGGDGSAIGDFGGDYGNYLKLLESDSALGFNPQADPIGENQVRK